MKDWKAAYPPQPPHVWGRRLRNNRTLLSAQRTFEAYSQRYGKTLFDYGIEVPLGASGEVKTLCPRCSPHRRKKRDKCLSVNVEEGLWHCWHCGWRGGLLQDGGRRLFQPKNLEPSKPDESARAKLRRRWKESRLITPGDPVDRYLRHRGVALKTYPPVLRYHSHLAYCHEDKTFTYHPAMLARIDDASGNAVSLHRTYLTHDGQKATVPTVKKCLSPLYPGGISGGAIRLFPASETLAVCEGIETALSVHVLTGVPVWAAVCSGGLARLRVPQGVRTVALFADHDPAGIAAAETLAKRLVAEGREVKPALPSMAGRDFNDVLRGIAP